jgi:hypothetical protein
MGIEAVIRADSKHAQPETIARVLYTRAIAIDN